MADRIPTELFEDILWYICGSPSDYLSTSKLQFSKRELGFCALVCRYWANNIREYLCKRLVLTSRQRALTYLSLAKATILNPNIGELVSELVLEYTFPPPYAPWIHLVVNCQTPRMFPNLENGPTLEMKCGLERISAASFPAPRTIHHYLPVTFPPRWSSLGKLVLSDLHFSRFEDLVSLVQSVVASDMVFCSSLSWDDDDTFDPNTAVTKVGNMRRSVEVPGHLRVRNCGDAWPFLWLLVTTLPPLGRPASLSPFTLHIADAQLLNLADVVRHVQDRCTCAICAMSYGNPRVREHEFVSSRAYCSIAVYTKINARQTHGLYCTLSDTGLVTSLDLRFNSEARINLAAPAAIGFDWTTLDDLASRFGPTMGQMTIWIEDIRDEHLRVFAPYVVARMPCMRLTRRLSLRYRGVALGFEWQTWEVK